MNQPDPIIFSRRLVLERGLTPGAVVVRGGVIQEVLAGEQHRAAATIDTGDLALMSGLVDSHVHVNEPGRTEWEGFATAGRAAAAGGITTIVAMPLNCDPVATTVAALRLEVDAAARSCLVDHGFWGGVIPGNQHELMPLHEAGVLGFKCFMVHSGIDEFPNVTEADLRKALPILRECGTPLLIHAEDAAAIEAAQLAANLDADPRSYSRYLASRPPGAETAAIQLAIRLSREFGVRMHIVHLAAAEPLAALHAARAEGLPISVETCPHFLTFAAEEVPDGATLFKCAPPIRPSADRDALWDALEEGEIDLIASDHSPCPPALKCLESGDFARAWGGVSSLQLGLSAVWTEARRRGFELTDVVRWMAVAPARLAGLNGIKGRIAPGYDADLVAFDPEASFTVHAETLEHRHKPTPYDGRVLAGVVHWTMRSGRMIYDASAGPVGNAARFPHEEPGRWLNRATLRQ